MARKREWTREKVVAAGIDVLRKSKQDYGAACLDQREMKLRGYGSILPMICGASGRQSFYISVMTYRRVCVHKYELQNSYSYLDNAAVRDIYRAGRDKAVKNMHNWANQKTLPGLIKKNREIVKEYGNIYDRRSQEEMRADLDEVEKKLEQALKGKLDAPDKISHTDIVANMRLRRNRKTYGPEVRTIHKFLNEVEFQRRKSGKYPDLSVTNSKNHYYRKLIMKYRETADLIALKAGGTDLFWYLIIAVKDS